MRTGLLLVALAAFCHGGCVPKSNAPPAQSSTQGANGTATPELPVIHNGPWMDSQLSSNERAKLLVAEMHQTEKLMLVFGYYGQDAAWKGYTAPKEARPGSAGYIPAIQRLGIPAQWQTDAGMGVATQGSATEKRERTALPSGLATAASWDRDQAERAGAMIGAEAHSSGFNVLLAGSVNLLRDQYCGRNFEYGGEDPLLAGEMTGHQIRGIQSQHVISTMKHFAINDQETARDTGNSIIEEAAARMSDLLAFEFANEIGQPGAVMCAYNKVNGDFSCENKELLTDVLRKDWSYPGFVLSDWGAVHSTAKAANAGLEQMSGWPFDDQPYFGEPLKRALDKGHVTEQRLDEMAFRILRTMFEHGLFEHPVGVRALDESANANVSRISAEGAAVLLKNEGALPLGPKTKTIAMFGGYADKGVLSGGGSSQVYPKGKNAVPGLSPTSWPGPVVYYPSSPVTELKRLRPSSRVFFNNGKDLKKAAKLAQSSEVAVVFATQWTTESIDTKIELEKSQTKLIDAVSRANKNTIVVLETGGPILMPWADNVSAILMAWYPGTAGGLAIARLLSGEVNPSGHLPLTIARSTSQLTHPKFPKPGNVEYKEGATVGYKWFDAKKHKPLFPFGHGLSYTDFDYLSLEAETSPVGIDVRFSYKNTGDRKGKDVVQVYVAREGWEAPQRLGAYVKTELTPASAAMSTVQIDKRLLAVWDTKKHAWVIKPGPVEIRLAKSSRDVVKRVTVELTGETLSPQGPFAARTTTTVPLSQVEAQ